jgi:hypothetical protein
MDRKYKNNIFPRIWRDRIILGLRGFKIVQIRSWVFFKGEI